MSPTTRVGEPDPNRGTAVGTITPERFLGKVAVVTGAGSGIGQATARRLAAEGGSVACLDIAADAIATVAAEINEGPSGRAVAIRCDVTNEDSVAAALSSATEQLGPVTVVCNVAGTGGFARTEEATLADWNKMIAVNLTGTFLVCRGALPGLLEHGGCITNVVSTAGRIGQPYSAAYCASKGGVALLTKALAVEYMGRGVRVNGVAPGGVDTPIIWNFMPPKGADQKLMDRIMTPMGFSFPSEIAGAMAFLSSDEAAYATGAILSIDGGVTA
ncbi:MAG TPA: SDR family NAD(P)-dependent oxidoreductase [Acidimicrobiales bacterium]|nr:SDR family NAD(P)-dependent oxidoreductase [Acidimicrobiales bacterium]